MCCSPTSFFRQARPRQRYCCQQTATIPIIFRTLLIRWCSGFVASVPRPGGNVTGFTNLEGLIAGKWLELLKEIAPRVNRVAFLFNPATATYSEIYLNPFKAAARSFAVEPIAAAVRDTSELKSVVAALARESNGGLIVMPDAFMAVRAAEVNAVADRYRLPLVSPYRFYTEHGGLLSYGFDLTDNYLRCRLQLIASSRARSPPTCRCRRRPNTTW